jgi:hypothetical protein
MANLHNYHSKYQPSMLHSIGSKVKNAAEFVAMAKGAWDIGTSIYRGAQALAPVAGSIAMALV